MVFTCDRCGTRQEKRVNPRAATRGTVFVQCAGCEEWHQLCDHLGLVEEWDFGPAGGGGEAPGGSGAAPPGGGAERGAEEPQR